MFYLQKAVLNIPRQRIKSLLMTAIAALVVLFLFLYFGGLAANERQLADLPRAMPVYARITNLNSTLSTELMIKESIIENLEASPYVTELSYAAQIGVSLNKIAEDEVEDMQSGDLTYPYAVAINGLENYPGLDAEDVPFIDGANASLLSGGEAVCILQEDELERLKLSVGDTVPVTVFSQTYPADSPIMTYKWLGIFGVKVVGSYESVSNEIVQTAPSNIIFPVNWFRQIEKEADVMFFADSASFRISNPLKLNAFKADMKNLLLMSVIPQANDSHVNIALTVNDEDFIAAATKVMDNISLLNTFTPFLCVTIGLIGFVTSYLLMHSRKSEIAIMRSLGLSRASCFAQFFLEAAGLNIIGAIIGFLFASLFTQISIVLICTVFFLFFFCFMSGTAVSLFMLGRFSVMTVLASLE